MFWIERGTVRHVKMLGTDKAWEVQDKLEEFYFTRNAEIPHPLPKTKKALPGGLTLEQQDAIKTLIRSRVDALPEDKRAKAAICCWSSIKSKFGCTYKAIAPEYFGEILSLIAQLVLEGEHLSCAKLYHYPRKLLEQPHFTTSKIPAALSISMLGNTTEFVSPLFALLNELRSEGHEISAPWDEAVAMREAVQ